MTPENFCYWLQGLFEIHGAGDQPLASFNHKQMLMVQQHLEYVFKKPQQPMQQGIVAQQPWGLSGIGGAGGLSDYYRQYHQQDQMQAIC